ncbi:phytanoyl-CoA dioxygenase family protein [Paenibacillus sp. CF384]|uniref:phytanoyl-CoA dioxygenase family protein n=1 Tax=Paenibacillus sp. CF384 TaxID=1884382 RepID=UPI000898400D|nr:phytanoyl-CoA dioxygenase family protein [Paenibacillus sp. CF384]SDX05083.1 Phytanoyl-CoA dioxygenase (PhyH) [Paenibacillus sp. CF384]
MLNPIVKPGEFTELDRFMFESWGYFVIPNVLSPDEIAACLEASQRLHADQPKKVSHQVGEGYASEPALERLIDHPAAMPKVRGLYGSDNIILQSAWCTVQPAGGKHGGWHQDGSSAFDFKLMGHPIPLLQLRVSYLLTDQSEPGKGNMEMIPGSHRSRVPMPDSVRKGTEECPLRHVVCAPAGSALVFHNAVWHRSHEHNHDYDRYTMHYIYSPPWMRYSDRFENGTALMERTTPLRRGLLGDFAKPDSTYAGGYKTPPYEE